MLGIQHLIILSFLVVVKGYHLENQHNSPYYYVGSGYYFDQPTPAPKRNFIEKVSVDSLKSHCFNIISFILQSVDWITDKFPIIRRQDGIGQFLPIIFGTVAIAGVGFALGMYTFYHKINTIFELLR